MINELINSYDNFFRDIADNKILTLLIVAVLALYASLWVNSLSPITTKLFSNIYFKTIVLILVSYVGSTNPVLAIMLAIVVVITLQSIADQKLISEVKKLEGFDPAESIKNTLNNDINSYLQNPLERAGQPCGENLTLRNQNQDYLLMIKKGKAIIEISNKLAKFAAETNDEEKLILANKLQSIGKNLTLSGYNRLQSAPEGAFVPGIPYPPPLDKYLNFMMSFDTKELREIYGVLVLKYEQLVSLTDPNKDVFINNLKDTLTTECDLLIEIYNIVKDNISPENRETIEKSLNKLKNRPINNTYDYSYEIYKVTKILL